MEKISSTPIVLNQKMEKIALNPKLKNKIWTLSTHKRVPLMVIRALLLVRREHGGLAVAHECLGRPVVERSISRKHRNSFCDRKVAGPVRNPAPKEC